MVQAQNDPKTENKELVANSLVENLFDVSCYQGVRGDFEFGTVEICLKTYREEKRSRVKLIQN